MEYSDDENRRWWDSLTKYDQMKILDLMIEKMNYAKPSPFQDSFAVSLSEQYERGQHFSPRQLMVIRKWGKGYPR